MRPQPPFPSTPFTSLLLPPPTNSPPSPTNLSAADTLTALSRQNTYLQRTLQALLDAQSAGLLAGLGQARSNPSSPQSQRHQRYKDDPSEGKYTDSPAPTSSRSPSQSSTRSSVDSTRQTYPTESVRRSKAGGISLQAARTGIQRTLHSLASLKTSESQALSSQLSTCSSTLSAITAASKKRRGIDAAIKKIEEDPSTGRAATQKLSEQEQGLESEIQALEERLAELKASLRIVKTRRVEGENKLDGRLSSWQHAKSELDKRIREEFLRRPPSRSSRAGLGTDRLAASTRPSGSRTPTPTRSREGRSDVGSPKGVESSVWDLPVERRTLELVRQEVEREVEGLKGRIEGVEEEGEACEVGAEVWGRCVKVVGGVEDTLKRSLGWVGEGGEVPGKGGMQVVLKEMGKAIEVLDGELRQAEEKEWKLLVCAIGAEGEALRLGREMLLAAVEEAGKMDGIERRRSQVDRGEENGEAREMDNFGSSHMEPALDNGTSGAADMVELARGAEVETDEDEGPGEDLLISRHES